MEKQMHKSIKESIREYDVKIPRKKERHPFYPKVLILKCQMVQYRMFESQNI
jgi:hypothetical protein